MLSFNFIKLFLWSLLTLENKNISSSVHLRNLDKQKNNAFYLCTKKTKFFILLLVLTNAVCILFQVHRQKDKGKDKEQTYALYLNTKKRKNKQFNKKKYFFFILFLKKLLKTAINIFKNLHDFRDFFQPNVSNRLSSRDKNKKKTKERKNNQTGETSFHVLW